MSDCHSAGTVAEHESNSYCDQSSQACYSSVMAAFSASGTDTRAIRLEK